jgi:hypothetical protein
MHMYTIFCKILKQRRDDGEYFVEYKLQHAKELLHGRYVTETADQEMWPSTVHIYYMDSTTQLARQFQCSTVHELCMSSPWPANISFINPTFIFLDSYIGITIMCQDQMWTTPLSWDPAQCWGTAPGQCTSPESLYHLHCPRVLQPLHYTDVRWPRNFASPPEADKRLTVQTYIYTFHGSISCLKTVGCGTRHNIWNIYRILQCKIFETFIESYNSASVNIPGNPYMPYSGESYNHISTS